MAPPQDPGPEDAPSGSSRAPEHVSPALRIPALYAIVAIAWIALSDRFLADVAGSPDAQAFWSTVKGIGFVAVTSLLLALGIRRGLRRERASARRAAETEAFFRSGFEHHEAVNLLIDPGSGRIVDANHEAAAFYGWPRQRLRQMRIHELNTLPEAVVSAEMRSAQEGHRSQFEFRHRRADGAVRDVTVFSGRVRVSGRVLLHSIVQDTTERKQAERGLQNAQRTLRMTSGCTEAILHAVTEDDLFSKVCQVVVESGGYRMCWVGVPGDDDRRLVVPVAHAGHEDGYLREILVSWADVPEGRGPTGTALREGRIVVGKDFRKDPLLALWSGPAARRGYGSSVALPLIRGDERLGVLTMYAEGVAAFSAEELALLRTLADDLAFGVQALRLRALRDRADADRERALRELAGEKDRFRALLDHSTDVTLVIDARGIITFSSPSVQTVLGVAPSAVVGRPASELLHPEDRAREAATMGALIEGRETVQHRELRLCRAGGEWAIVDANLRAMLAHPAVRGIVLNGRDITERIETERQLRERERFLDMVLATALDAFWVVDTTGQILEVNDAARSMLGFTREELLARTIGDVEDAMDAEEIAARMQALVEAGCARFGSRHRRKDGRIIEVEVSATLLPFGGGRVVAFIRDVTDRRKAERTLQASQARLQEAQRLAHLGSWELELQTGVLSWSEEVFRIFEIDPARFGASYEAFLAAIHPEDRASVDAAFQRSQATRTPYEITHRLLLPDGRVKFVQERCETFYDSDGRALRSVGTVQDVTERKQAEAAVRSSEALLRAIANSSPDSIFAKDREGRWTFANTAALRVAGKPAEEVLGRTDEEVMGDRLLASALTANDREVLATGTARSYEEAVDGPTGRRLFLATKAPLRDPDGRVVGIAGVAKDVTEIRKLQDQLAVASRLAAMGTLVAGVAHEVNNPLAGVLAGTEMATEDVKKARTSLEEGAPASAAEAARLLGAALDSLADAQAGGQRIAQIVKDLSLFARPNPQRARVQVAQVVDQAMRWLPVSLRPAAIVRVEDRGAPDVMASFGQIGQVIVNLVTNAAKAMPRGRRGEVVVRLGPGGPGMARLEVIDDGVGMAPGVIERIFDPFFTTRSAGEGTGLGLPIIHAIVTAHGGTITVQSELGKGSTFRVELPAAPVEA